MGSVPITTTEALCQAQCDQMTSCVTMAIGVSDENGYLNVCVLYHDYCTNANNQLNPRWGLLFKRKRAPAFLLNVFFRVSGCEYSTYNLFSVSEHFKHQRDTLRHPTFKRFMHHAGPQEKPRLTPGMRWDAGTKETHLALRHATRTREPISRHGSTLTTGKHNSHAGPHPGPQASI